MSMSESKRLHPVAAITGLLSALREFIVPFVLIYFFGREGGSYQWFFALAIVIPAFLGIGRWLRFRYQFEGSTLKVEEGLLVQKKITIPKNRVQSIDVSAGLVQRLFGLVSVKIQTAGNEEAAVDLNAVTKEEADRVMSILSQEFAGLDEQHIPPEPEPSFSLSFDQLLAAGLSSGKIGLLLSLVGIVFSQIDTMIEVEDLLYRLEQLLPALAQSTFLLVFSAILLAWIFSVLGTIVSYYGFVLIKKEQELVVRYGLLKKKQVSVPYNRIQAIRFSEGLLRQPFGYGALFVESAGQGDEKQQSSCIIAPYIHRDEVNRVLADVLPEFCVEGVEWQTVPERAHLRYVLRLMRPLLVPVALNSWVFDFGWLSLFAVPFAYVLATAQYRDAAFAHSGSIQMLRFRGLIRSTVIHKRNRIQSVRFSTTPLLMRRDLWSYSITLASVSKTLVYGLSYLGSEQQGVMRDWVFGKNEPTGVDAESRTLLDTTS